LVAGAGAQSSQASATVRRFGAGLASGAAWAVFGASCLWWDDLGDWSRTQALASGAFAVAALVVIASAVWRSGTVADQIARRLPWLTLLGVFLAGWEITTAKFGWLGPPLFPRP